MDAATQVFWGSVLAPAKRIEQQTAIAKNHPGIFTNAEDVGAFLARVELPASRRWALAVNPKCACTSVKRFLFRLEFGCDLSANYTSLFDINSDAPAQRLSVAQVFRGLNLIDNPETVLGETLRLTTSRHPATRAVSMFTYICQSNRSGHPFFVDERLRMNALVAFDWERDPNTRTGFSKFLDYIAICFDSAPVAAVDFHWRRQVDTVRPDFFHPELVGDVDDLPSFYAKLAARLAPESKVDLPVGASNRHGSHETALRLLSAQNLRRVETVYAADYEWLDVNHDEWKRHLSVNPRPAPKSHFLNRYIKAAARAFPTRS